MTNKNTQAYKNKLKYIRQYKKEHTKSINFMFNMTDEEDKKLYDFLMDLGKVSSKTAYFKALIKEDMKRRGL